MPNAPVPAAATGLPTLTLDQAIDNLRAGLLAHFADLGQAIDFDAEISALVLIDAIAGRRVSR